MQQFDIPIIHKAYELYKALHLLQSVIPKMERYTLWQRAENRALDVLEGLICVGYIPQEKRVEQLIQVSTDVDMLRVLLRLALDVKSLSQKKYVELQAMLDEIGRMLGGWMKSLKK